MNTPRFTALLSETLRARHALAEPLLIHGVAASLVRQVRDLLGKVSDPLQRCRCHGVAVQQNRITHLQRAKLS